MSDNKKITFYGASWCGDCVRARYILDKYKVEYDYVDIDKDEVAEKFVLDVNDGMRSIPVILFTDGSTLTEPNNNELLGKLNLA